MKRIASVALIVIGLLTGAFAAQQSTGTLKGKVEAEKGKALADVQVRVMSSRTREVKETKTDANGHFQMDLEPDSYTLSFDIEGYGGGTMRDMEQIEAGKTTEVKTIVLAKARRTSKISGAVFDLNGHGIGGVHLKLERIRTDDQAKEHKKFGSVSREYITNTQGEFAFRVPPEQGRYKVTAKIKGYETQTKYVNVGESEAVPLAFTLERAKK